MLKIQIENTRKLAKRRIANPETEFATRQQLYK